MRRTVEVRNRAQDYPEIVRVMVCADDGGYYLFLYDSAEDGPCKHDHHMDELADVSEYVRDEFGIEDEDWTDIPDYPEGCQQDWIAPTRRITGPDGKTRCESAAQS